MQCATTLVSSAEWTATVLECFRAFLILEGHTHTNRPRLLSGLTFSILQQKMKHISANLWTYKLRINKQQLPYPSSFRLMGMQWFTIILGYWPTCFLYTSDVLPNSILPTCHSNIGCQWHEILSENKHFAVAIYVLIEKHQKKKKKKKLRCGLLINLLFCWLPQCSYRKLVYQTLHWSSYRLSISRAINLTQ